MPRLDDPSFTPSARPRVEGSRVLMNLPSRAAPAALPSAPRASLVLQSRRAPTQLSLFPPPGQLLPRGSR